MALPSLARRVLAAAALSVVVLAGAFSADALAAKPDPTLTISPSPAMLEPGRAVWRGVVVSFDGTGSVDPDGGAITKYEFDLDGDGSYERDNGNDPTTSRRYTVAARYTIRMRVTDDEGETQFYTYSKLTVHRPPVARLTAPGAALIGQEVVLDASASTDDLDPIQNFRWDLDGDGTYETDTEQRPTVRHTFTGAAGNRTVRVRVSDTNTAIGEGSVTVYAHRAPTATFVATPAAPFAGERVAFAAAAADEESIAKYEWDLDGDGSFETDTGTDPTAARAYADPATIQVGLRVTDPRGATTTVSRSLTIAPLPVQQTGRDTTPPAIVISRARLRATKKGAVAIKLTCPATEIGGCSGRLQLADKKGKRYGATTFRLTRGQSAKVTVKLEGVARTTLRRRGKIGAFAMVVATDAAGNTGTTAATLKVKPAKR
jgi:PKD repeat protein